MEERVRPKLSVSRRPGTCFPSGYEMFSTVSINMYTQTCIRTPYVNGITNVIKDLQSFPSHLYRFSQHRAEIIKISENIAIARAETVAPGLDLCTWQVVMGGGREGGQRPF